MAEEQIPKGALRNVPKAVAKTEGTLRPYLSPSPLFEAHLHSFIHSFIQIGVARALAIVTPDNPKSTPKRPSASFRVEEGDRIYIPKIVKKMTATAPPTRDRKDNEPERNPLTPQDKEIARSWVIYTDSRLLAINKPYDLPVQGTASLQCIVTR